MSVYVFFENIQASANDVSCQISELFKTVILKRGSILSHVSIVKFHLNQTILIFWTKFSKKGYLFLNTGQMNLTNEFNILELM